MEEGLLKGNLICMLFMGQAKKNHNLGKTTSQTQSKFT